MHRKIEVANPHRTKAAREKGRSMAHHKNAKAANGGATRKKSNPFKKKYMELLSKRRKGSRNPSGLGDVIGSPKDIAVTGLSALGSAVATKQLPQMILGSGNTGAQGYIANAVAGLAATWAAGSFIGRGAGAGAFAGALVIILDRVLTDQFSELGPVLSLSGVGDATSYGKLGTIRDGYFFHPGLVDGNGNMITPQPVLDAAVQQVLAAYPQIAAPLMQATSGGRMGAARPGNLRPHMANSMMLSSRFQSRFNR
jgi:hypothetical protein